MPKKYLSKIGCKVKIVFSAVIQFLTWRKVVSFLIILCVCILIILAFVAFYSANWYAKTYGRLGFDSILYTLLTYLGGVGSDLVSAYLAEEMGSEVFNDEMGKRSSYYTKNFFFQ